MNYEAASQSSMSGLNPYRDMSSIHTDGFSSQDVFAGLVKDLDALFDEACACEAEFKHYSKKANQKRSKSREESSSHQSEVEYREILNKKGDFLEKMTATIDEIQSCPSVPKFKIQCYQQYCSLLKQRYENSRQEINQNLEDMKKINEEYERVAQQVETFKKLLEDQQQTNESDEISKLFTEAKNDLSTVLSRIFPGNPAVKEEFSNTMALLTDVFSMNDCEEDQYAELSPKTLQNRGICCMVKSQVIVADPSNPLKYRLNMGE